MPDGGVSALSSTALLAPNPSRPTSLPFAAKKPKGGKIMAVVNVEARPKGRPEGERIDDYVVEDQPDHVVRPLQTQAEAIAWAKSNGHSPHVARVRNLNDKKRPDHWRPV